MNTITNFNNTTNNNKQEEEEERLKAHVYGSPCTLRVCDPKSLFNLLLHVEGLNKILELKSQSGISYNVWLCVCVCMLFMYVVMYDS